MSLPRSPTRCIGRERDLARLIELRETNASILTLWGAPGVGKTRLAIELCRRSSLPSTFVDLTSARDAAEVCAIVAGSLRDDGGVASSSWIAGALAARGNSILVLDNFDQLVRCAAETVGAWAHDASDVWFVITSRERLRIAQETTH